MKKLLGVLSSLAMLSLVVAGCGMGKSATDAAISMSQSALDAAKAKAMNIAPDQVATIQAAIDTAKAIAGRGDYKGAIEAIKPVPEQVKAMADGLPAKEQELKGQWEQMQGLSTQVEAFKAQVDKLTALKKLPAGMDATKLDAAKSALATMTQAWGEAQTAVQSRNLPEATAKAGTVKSLLTQGMTAMGMSLPEALKS